jgi:hypothetical protein
MPADIIHTDFLIIVPSSILALQEELSGTGGSRQRKPAVSRHFRKIHCICATNRLQRKTDYFALRYVKLTFAERRLGPSLRGAQRRGNPGRRWIASLLSQSRVHQ